MSSYHPTKNHCSSSNNTNTTTKCPKLKLIDTKKLLSIKQQTQMYQNIYQDKKKGTQTFMNPNLLQQRLLSIMRRQQQHNNNKPKGKELLNCFLLHTLETPIKQDIHKNGIENENRRIDLNVQLAEFNLPITPFCKWTMFELKQRIQALHDETLHPPVNTTTTDAEKKWNEIKNGPLRFKFDGKKINLSSPIVQKMTCNQQQQQQLQDLSSFTCDQLRSMLKQRGINIKGIHTLRKSDLIQKVSNMNKHQYIGKPIARIFSSLPEPIIIGTVVDYFEPDEEYTELFHILHEDGGEEDLTLEEVECGMDDYLKLVL
jgi:hypothetical protein